MLPCRYTYQQQQQQRQHEQQQQQYYYQQQQQQRYERALPSDTAFLTTSNFRQNVFYGTRPWLLLVRRTIGLGRAGAPRHFARVMGSVAASAVHVRSSHDL